MGDESGFLSKMVKIGERLLYFWVFLGFFGFFGKFVDEILVNFVCGVVFGSVRKVWVRCGLCFWMKMWVKLWVIFVFLRTKVCTRNVVWFFCVVEWVRGYFCGVKFG